MSESDAPWSLSHSSPSIILSVACMWETQQRKRLSPHLFEGVWVWEGSWRCPSLHLGKEAASTQSQWCVHLIHQAWGCVHWNVGCYSVWLLICSWVGVFKINEALTLNQGAIIKNTHLAAVSHDSALINSIWPLCFGWNDATLPFPEQFLKIDSMNNVANMVERFICVKCCACD